MIDIPTPPEGSRISIQREADGLLLTWANPTSGWMRFGPAAFLIFWLCGWAVGEAFAIKQLFHSKHSGIDLFLIGWLGAWTVGGFFCATMIYKLLRSPRPERIRLNAQEFFYDPGTTFLSVNQFQVQQQTQTPLNFLAKRKPVTIPKGKLSLFCLERVGERQRLSVDHGSERIEIGALLNEPEREWLKTVLEAWRAI